MEFSRARFKSIRLPPRMQNAIPYCSFNSAPIVDQCEGNNGRVYVTLSVKSILMALDASSGNIQWKHSIGPLSGVGASPVVDSNGWVSVGLMDRYMYSVSPDGDLRKFRKSSAIDSAIQVDLFLDWAFYGDGNRDRGRRGIRFNVQQSRLTWSMYNDNLPREKNLHDL